MSLSAWLLVAARERIEAGRSLRHLASPEDLWALFHGCDEVDGPETEPDWSEHLNVIAESRAGGVSGT